MVYLLKGDYSTAGPMYQEALAIRGAALGPHHPDMAKALTSEAIFFDVTGRTSEAVARQAQAAEVVEGNLTLILTPVLRCRSSATWSPSSKIPTSRSRWIGRRSRPVSNPRALP